MAIADLAKKIQKLVQDNSTALLTGIGAAGTISTAVLTGRASFKAARMIDWAAKEVYKDAEDQKSYKPLDLQDKVKLVWKFYIPPVATGMLTVTSIIMANRLATKEAAALAAAYSLTERALSEYREKVIEKIGESKEGDIRDSMVQARMNKNPVNSREIILAGTGEVLCFDVLSGRYFQSSIEEIKKAENEINYKVVNYMHSSLSEFYDEIGLPATGFSDSMGFNLENRCVVQFSTQMSTDGRPAIAIDFAHMPVVGYDKHYGA